MIWPLAAAVARKLPGEAAHRLAVKSLSLGLGPRLSSKAQSPSLKTKVAGLDFQNPIGLAAGFDKNAEAIKGSLNLGFGFVEVGTITPKPQPGNPKPRVFRLPSDGAVINRYGFNNGGMDDAGLRLAAFRQQDGKTNGIVGVNIGANKDSQDRVHDYYLTAECLAAYADYLTVNVSSPNTPGLRGLQEPEFLAEVLTATHEGMAASGKTVPVMLKIAPDLDDDGLQAALQVALNHHCAGIIIANTTISRPDDLTHHHQAEAGGLSGKPVFMLSSIMVEKASRYLRGAKAVDALPIIAVGGVDSAAAAYTKLLLGASLVQIYTALALNGPQLVDQLLSGLAERLERDGLGGLASLKNSSLSFEEAYRLASS